MYQMSYAEVMSDSADTARAEERRCFGRAVDLLCRADGTGPRSPEGREAITYTTQLWSFMVKSLASPDNDLPGQLRADLMSVGLGVMAEAGRIERGASENYAGLADICGIIRDGLN